MRDALPPGTLVNVRGKSANGGKCVVMCVRGEKPPRSYEDWSLFDRDSVGIVLGDNVKNSWPVVRLLIDDEVAWFLSDDISPTRNVPK